MKQTYQRMARPATAEYRHFIAKRQLSYTSGGCKLLSLARYCLRFEKGGGGGYIGFSRKGVRSKGNPALITALPMNRHYSLRHCSARPLSYCACVISMTLFTLGEGQRVFCTVACSLLVLRLREDTPSQLTAHVRRQFEIAKFTWLTTEQDIVPLS